MKFEAAVAGGAAEAVPLQNSEFFRKMTGHSFTGWPVYFPQTRGVL
jgi:hypothetical protein